MRTTLNIDDHLLTAAKHRALDENVPLSQMIENALREALAKPKDGGSPVLLITVNGTGVKPGVNLDNTASLLDIMDDRS